MARRLDKTLADYAAIAISPALIMTLVGSLVFFLLEVFYQGHAPARLSFILGAFVFAAVLVARVAIESGLERAAMFALALAVVTGLAIHRFVVVRGVPAPVGMAVNLALMGLIWWCAHKLTWDCTVIDETKDVSGEGLLQTVGLDESESPQAAEEATHRHGARRQRPHAPGVWVVYFSLAALPVFGLGQLLVPLSSLDRRRWVFLLLLVYVASGMGLLLTTSFLRLRRYLRQRRLQMPTKMANVWLTIGALMTVLFLAFAMLLPRPAAEYAISSLTGIVGSPESETTEKAVGDEGRKTGQKNARTGSSGEDKPKRDAGHDSENAQSDSEQASATGKRGGQGAPKDHGPRDAQGERSSGGKQQKSSDSNQGQNASNADKSQSKSQQQPNPKPGKSKEPAEANRGNADNSSRERRVSREDQQGENPSGERRGDNQGSPAQSSPPRSSQADVGSWLGVAFKWLFNIVLFAGVAYLIWRFRRELRVAIVQLIADIKDFWQRLFGAPKRPEIKSRESAEPSSPGSAGRPFADYPNPFANGLAQRATATQLIVYSFEAMEAWARDHGCPRGPEETPREFAAQLAVVAPELGQSSRELAGLYSRVAYAPGALPAVGLEGLQRLWRELQSTTVA